MIRKFWTSRREAAAARSARARQKRRIAARRRTLRLETLDDRRLLAVITVDNLDDNIEVDGRITLREAIFAANNDTLADADEGTQAGSGADTIEFAANLAGQRINLSIVGDTNFNHSALRIETPITIVGDAEQGIIIARDAEAVNMRLFYVTNEGELTLQRLTLRGGVSQGGHGGDSGDGGGGGGAVGAGGAIANEGKVTLERVTLTENQAIGGRGGRLLEGAIGGGGGGGGLVGDSLNGKSANGSNGNGGGGDFGGNGGIGRYNSGGSATGIDGSSVPSLFGGGGGGGGGGYGGVPVGNPAHAGSGYGGAGGSSAYQNGSGGGGGGFGFGTGSGFIGKGGNGGDGSFGSGGGGGGGGYGRTALLLGRADREAGEGGQAGFAGGDGGAGVTGTGPNFGEGIQFGGGGGGGGGLGGAIFNDRFATLTIINSTLAENAARGGDAGGRGAEGGSGYGGAIFNIDGAVTITNSTLATNQVFAGARGSSGRDGKSDGGALYSLKLEQPVAITLKNTILANSVGGRDVVINGSSSVTGVTNLIENNTGVPAAMIATTSDPELRSLHDNGGPTLTHALQENSPAIDAGTDADAPPIDQRGYARPRDGNGDGTATVDIGAFEARRLQLAIQTKPISENGGATTATVTRGGAAVELADALEVQLFSNDESEATVPTAVTIPAGQPSADFQITAVDDSAFDGTQPVTLTAQASDYFDATATLNVTDHEPAVVRLKNISNILPENANLTNRFRVADIDVQSVPVGTVSLALSGADADQFEFTPTALFLKAGTPLDFETKPKFNVTVEVDDSGVTGSPDNSASLMVSITDVNEPPSIQLTNTTTTLPENTDVTTSRVNVATIVIVDDALGSESLSLSGDDAGLFEIVTGGLFLRRGITLDFETNPQLDVTVAVDDSTVGTTPDATAALSIALSDAEESAWHNSGNPFDINGVDGVTPLDVLTLITYINEHPGETALPAPPAAPPPYLDVTNDGMITALDVIGVINFINDQINPQPAPPGNGNIQAAGEGEGPPSVARLLAAKSPTPTAHRLSQIAPVAPALRVERLEVNQLATRKAAPANAAVQLRAKLLDEATQVGLKQRLVDLESTITAIARDFRRGSPRAT